MPNKSKTAFWVKFVFILGFLLQFILAFMIFDFLSSLSYLQSLKEQLQFIISLLISLMLATPLGFLGANFIFHYLPINKKLKNLTDYKGTQIILLKVLIFTILFLSLIIGILIFIF